MTNTSVTARCHRGIYSAISFAMLTTTLAWGQIELMTEPDYRIYLQFEPIKVVTTAKVMIGQPAVFNGPDDGPRFYYEVRNEHGHLLSPLPESPVHEAVMVPAQGSVMFTNVMDRMFPLRQPGSYSIQPCVDWLNKTYRGGKRHLEVVTGREVTRISGLVPGNGSTRTYKVYHINRGQQDHLLLRIDDESADLCYGVFALGRSVMNEKPELAIDGKGQAHILFQASPWASTHAVFTAFGERIGRDTYGREYRRIRLNARPDGVVEAVGLPAEKTDIPIVDSILEDR